MKPIQTAFNAAQKLSTLVPNAPIHAVDGIARCAGEIRAIVSNSRILKESAMNAITLGNSAFQQSLQFLSEKASGSHQRAQEILREQLNFVREQIERINDPDQRAILHGEALDLLDRLDRETESHRLFLRDMASLSTRVALALGAATLFVVVTRRPPPRLRF